MTQFLSVLFFVIATLGSYSVDAAPMVLQVDKSLLKKQKFKPRYFGEGDFKAALAMNISYQPILSLRRQIQESLYQGRPLKFLTAWEKAGEAHVTTIGPVEYQECMWSTKRNLRIIHMKEINRLAYMMGIQSSDLKVEGMGVAVKKFRKPEYSHFVLVTSKNLLRIRNAVYKFFLSRGGDPSCWHPSRFFPHITVGYTHKDIHWPDVKKNKFHALDRRFVLRWR